MSHAGVNVRSAEAIQATLRLIMTRPAPTPCEHSRRLQSLEALLMLHEDAAAADTYVPPDYEQLADWLRELGPSAACYVYLEQPALLSFEALAATLVERVRLPRVFAFMPAHWRAILLPPLQALCVASVCALTLDEPALACALALEFRACFDVVSASWDGDPLASVRPSGVSPAQPVASEQRPWRQQSMVLVNEILREALPYTSDATLDAWIRLLLAAAPRYVDITQRSPMAQLLFGVSGASAIDTAQLCACARRGIASVVTFIDESLSFTDRGHAMLSLDAQPPSPVRVTIASFVAGRLLVELLSSGNTSLARTLLVRADLQSTFAASAYLQACDAADVSAPSLATCDALVDVLPASMAAWLLNRSSIAPAALLGDEHTYTPTRVRAWLERFAPMAARGVVGHVLAHLTSMPPAALEHALELLARLVPTRRRPFLERAFYGVHSLPRVLNARAYALLATSAAAAGVVVPELQSRGRNDVNIGFLEALLARTEPHLFPTLDLCLIDCFDTCYVQAYEAPDEHVRAYFTFLGITEDALAVYVSATRAHLRAALLTALDAGLSFDTLVAHIKCDLVLGHVLADAGVRPLHHPHAVCAVWLMAPTVAEEHRLRLDACVAMKTAFYYNTWNGFRTSSVPVLALLERPDLVLNDAREGDDEQEPPTKAEWLEHVRHQREEIVPALERLTARFFP